MKKVLLSVAVIATTLFVACGPSAEEIAKKDKATADSLAAVAETEKMMAEEAAKHAADSMAMVAEHEKMMADSMAMAAKAKGSQAAPKKKTVEQKVKEEVKKVTHGKG